MSNQLAMHFNICDMAIGNGYNDVYILKKHATKMTKTNKQYLDMTLQDKTGEVPAKCWVIPRGAKLEDLKDGAVVFITATAEEYGGQIQLNVSNFRMLGPDEYVDMSQLIPMAPESAENMYNELMQTALSFNNHSLKSLVVEILTRKRELLMFMPGAQGVHHDVVAGLLWHLTRMLRVAKGIADAYKGVVNRDLLLAGVILHDIEKTTEFQPGEHGLVEKYTKRGSLLGHPVMGMQYIHQVGTELNIDEEVLLLLEHMLISHHGLPEQGAVKVPMFLEANLLYLVDMIDSRTIMYTNAYKNIQPGEVSQSSVYYLGTRVYRPALDVEEAMTPVANATNNEQIQFGQPQAQMQPQMQQPPVQNMPQQPAMYGAQMEIPDSFM